MLKRPFPVTTVILAGGRGVRIGGDKGLKILHGKPLIDWVLAAVKPNSAEVMLNANGSQNAYASFGCRIISDKITDSPGPLAGLHAGLHSAQTEYVLTVPCDTPFLPQDLIARLWQSCSQAEVEAAVAVADGYRQPTIALYRQSVLNKLDAFIGAGGRKVNDWLDSLRLNEVVFDNAVCFDNINSAEDLARAEQSLTNK